LDGTLIDSRRDIAASCNAALRERGHPPLDDAEIATFVGDGARTLIARALRLPDSDPEVSATLAAFLAHYEAHPAVHTELLPGAMEALAAARPAKVGVVTNKGRSVSLAVLAALGLDAHVDVLVAGGDGPLKPHPAPVLRAAAQLGATPARVWMVGDGLQDIAAGRAAGAVTVGIPGPFHGEAALEGAQATAVLASLADLPRLLSAARAPAP
jgi:phosphoglycolate phosphatase